MIFSIKNGTRVGMETDLHAENPLILIMNKDNDVSKMAAANQDIF
ncbi:MAG TPA: hypothetical protein VH796_04515 [Nitrososphaeraceae archaeon]